MTDAPPPPPPPGSTPPPYPAPPPRPPHGTSTTTTKWLLIGLGTCGALFVVFVLVAAIAGIATQDRDDSAINGTGTTQRATTTPSERDRDPGSDSTTSTRRSTTTTQPPTTTTTAPPPPPPPVVYEGTGDDVIEVAKPEPVSIAIISHRGSRNFAVWTLGADNEKLDLLVNVIGDYDGTRLVDADEDATRRIEISADGPWRIELAPLSSARAFDPSIDGVGDDVVIYMGGTGIATLHHSGQSNFAIWYYGSRTDLLVNEIGPYDGRVPIGGGPAVLDINADGPWSVTVE